jgi:hypothetical protein
MKDVLKLALTKELVKNPVKVEAPKNKAAEMVN